MNAHLRSSLLFAFSIGIAGLAFPAQAQAQAGPVLTLDAGDVTAKVSPMLYGLMTEEINYSYEGGLYAELIRNRSFRDNPNAPDHWAVVQDAGGPGTIALDDANPIPDTVLAKTLKLDASHASAGHRVGISNDGYWGIPVKPNTVYRVSFYAKADSAKAGPLKVQIESPDGAKVYADGVVPNVTNQWEKYSLQITTKSDATPTVDTIFTITTETPGTYWFDLVSVFPPTFNDRPNGTRPDIMQLLTDMQPHFIRLPGGNFLEGDLISDRFPWKQTIGPLEQRPGHRGCWRYGANDGFGLLEMLEWCEDLHNEPVLAVYAGYSLKGDHVNPGPDLQPYVQDALDEIEYVTGDATTKWGAERVKDGHPAPFPLHYVEIGNEDGFDKSQSYDGRFKQFSDAIRAKYPNLQCIATAGGQDPLGKRVKLKMSTPDAIDEHYYRQAVEMELDAHHYDAYDRKGPKVFVGEWATREGAPTTNLNAALGDAAWMTGMERNSDIVVLASYAPLFVNVNHGGMQWPSDLIGYNTLTSYGSPSYYAQKMFSHYLGDSVISVKDENIGTQWITPSTKKPKPGQSAPPPAVPVQVPTLFYVATKNSKTGAIYLKVVNTASAPQNVQINVKGATVAPEGKLVTLTSSAPGDTNTITDPTKIVPQETKATGLSASFTQTFPPYSVNVLQLETK